MIKYVLPQKKQNFNKCSKREGRLHKGADGKNAPRCFCNREKQEPWKAKVWTKQDPGTS